MVNAAGGRSIIFTRPAAMGKTELTLNADEIEAFAAIALQEPIFPIMGPRNRTIRSVPWSTVERARSRAEAALKMPLERIAALGGFEARELLAYLDPHGVKERRKAKLPELEALIAEQIGDPA